MGFKKTMALLAACAGSSLTLATPASAQEVYMGTIEQFAFNYCPRGWMATNGQLLPISQYQSLFSLIGTTYGGDGRTTFQLPDLRGRTMIGLGRGNGLPEYRWGQQVGWYETTLTIANMPQHNHTAVLRAEDAPGTTDNPTGALLADFPNGQTIYATGSANVSMAADAIQVSMAGNSQSFSLMQPSLAMTTCIAVDGYYPPRP